MKSIKILTSVLSIGLTYSTLVMAEIINNECLTQDLAGQYYSMHTKPNSTINLKDLGILDKPYTFNSSDPNQYRFEKNLDGVIQNSTEAVYNTETPNYDQSGKLLAKNIRFKCHFETSGLEGLAARNAAKRELTNPRILTDTDENVSLVFNTKVGDLSALYICDVEHNYGSQFQKASFIRAVDIITAFNKTPILSLDSKLCIRVQETKVDKSLRNRNLSPKSSATEDNAIF